MYMSMNNKSCLMNLAEAWTLTPSYGERIVITENGWNGWSIYLFLLFLSFASDKSPKTGSNLFILAINLGNDFKYLASLRIHFMCCALIPSSCLSVLHCHSGPLEIFNH